MENKIMEENAVIRKLNINNTKYRKIIHTIKKRHEQDGWIVTKNFAGQSKRYLKLEAVDWIESVYLRNPVEHYLNAEISFTQNHIQRLEKELHFTKNIFPTSNMDIQTLSKTFDISRTSLTQTSKQLLEAHPEWYVKQDKIIIKEKGIEWIITNCYRKIYFNLLNEYKRDLQRRKRSEQKHGIRKTH